LIVASDDSSNPNFSLDNKEQEYMTPERWQRINEVFQAALEQDPTRRSAFLDEACSGDRALRGELESLLASDAREWQLIEKPAIEVAAPMLAGDQSRLAPGEHIGHYEILSLIGTGGMGEVYLAQDERLNRRIALKLLPVHSYLQGKDPLRRFQQEAQAASALNHPNIITIYELGELDGEQFIATEFVEGETLRHHLKRPGWDLDKVLAIAIQTASALAAAHEAGIVHRDIKPENIMLRRDGIVKVLDFGLAKLAEQQLPPAGPEALTARKVETTTPGLVLGTVKYMSPEQARGLKVDARSDIFSFGVVLYELVAGRAPFEGETVSDLIAAILKEEPPLLTKYLPTAPEELQRILGRALRKEKKARYQTIQELLSDLKALRKRLQLPPKPEVPVLIGLNHAVAVETADRVALTTVGTEAIRTASSAEYVVREISRHKAGAAITLAILFTVLATVGFMAYRFSRQGRPNSAAQNLKLMRMTTSGSASNAAISPDGKYVAYVASEAGQNSVWIRQVDSAGNVQIIPPGDSYCWGLTFSRDGNYLYYFGQGKADKAASLYKIPALGGGVSDKLIEGIDTNFTPVSFAPDGARLVFVRNYPGGETAVVVVNADGTGERKIASRADKAFFWTAAWSPDGARIACAEARRLANGQLQADVVEIDPESGAQKPINDQGWSWINDIAWLSDGTGLLITAGDNQAESSKVSMITYPGGTARRIITDLNGYSGLSLSMDSSAFVTTRSESVVNIFMQPRDDATRAQQNTFGAATNDGWSGMGWTLEGRIVYSSSASGHPDIWTMDADGKNQKQLTRDLGSNFFGLSVSPDGRYIAFTSLRAGNAHIWRIDADGRNPKQLTNGDWDGFPVFLPDGQWLSYRSIVSGKETSLKISAEGGEPMQLDSPYQDIVGISPDGRLTAYIPPADQSNKKRIAVARSEGGEAIRIFDLPSEARPRRMQWSADGRALTYMISRGRADNIWSQPIDGSPPTQLTDFKTSFIHCFAWSRDGKQLAMARGTETKDVVLIKSFR
jgi:eukaryotic-like serine/threonine-protein kinase